MSDPAPSPVDALGAKVPLSRPGESGYATATRIWPAPANDELPIAVAHCRTAEDVRHVLRAARKHGLPVSVRGGGHDWAGRALCPGLVIDLRPMRGVTVEAGGDSALMGGGTLARDVFQVADPIGRAAVTSSIGSVGMGGFTLGGGYGSLIGRFGLAADNLMTAEVVLADASIVVAAAAGDTLFGLGLGIVILDFGVQGTHVSNQTRVLGLDASVRNRLNTLYMVSFCLGGAVGSALAGWSWTHWGWGGVTACGGAFAVAGILSFAIAPRRAQPAAELSVP